MLENIGDTRKLLSLFSRNKTLSIRVEKCAVSLPADFPQINRNLILAHYLPRELSIDVAKEEDLGS